MLADFKKIKHFGSFGTIRGDTLEVNMVSVDGTPPRLHIGRWTADGEHKRWSGFLSETMAADLWGILDGLKLDSGNK